MLFPHKEENYDDGCDVLKNLVQQIQKTGIFNGAGEMELLMLNLGKLHTV